jgi:cation diffusion facilitator family transporter
LETLTALVVGMLLIVTGVLISIRSMQRAFEVQHAPAAFAIWALVISIGVKGVLGFAKRRVGRRIGSAALTADSWNDAMDMFSGAAALVAVSMSVFDPVRFVWADHLGGAAVGLIVIFVGGRVAHDTTLQLMDTMPDPRRMKEIRETALGVPGALAVEKCFARKTGLKYHVDMHLEVDPGMTVYESHEIATRVRDRIREKLDWVADVLVHVEPHMLATISGKPHGKP